LLTTVRYLKHSIFLVIHVYRFLMCCLLNLYWDLIDYTFCVYVTIILYCVFCFFFLLKQLLGQCPVLFFCWYCLLCTCCFVLLLGKNDDDDDDDDDIFRMFLSPSVDKLYKGKNSKSKRRRSVQWARGSFGVDEERDQIITPVICVHQIFEINGSGRAGDERRRITSFGHTTARRSDRCRSRGRAVDEISEVPWIVVVSWLATTHVEHLQRRRCSFSNCTFTGLVWSCRLSISCTLQVVIGHARCEEKNAITASYALCRLAVSALSLE